MRWLSAFLSAVLTATLVIAVPSAATEVPDEQARVITPDGFGWQGAWWTDNDLISDWPSQVQGHSDPSRPGEYSVCANAQDPKCAEGYTSLIGRAYLEPCSATATLYCIEGLTAFKTDETVEASFTEYAPAVAPGGGTPEVTELNIPRGGSQSVWSIPGATHAGGTDQYIISVSQVYFADRKTSAEPWTRANLTELWVRLVPVTKVESPIARVNSISELGGGTYSSVTSGCFATDVNICWLPWAFPDDTSFSVSVRFATVFSGWLHGRLADPSIDVKVESPTRTVVSFKGSPVRVPTLNAWARFNDLPSGLQERYRDNPGCCGGPYGAPPDERQTWSMPMRDSSPDQSFQDFIRWLPIMKDTATTNPMRWTVRTLSWRETTSGPNNCYNVSGRLNGIVTTNATVYSPGPPLFSEETQTLDYVVASPHFDPRGEKNVGSYSLQLRSDVARCLYGFSNAPIRASISIVTDQGEQRVATEVVSEVGGWLYLTARGFTYSSPTLRVRLSQPAPTPTPTATATPNPVVPVKVVKVVKAPKKVTCVKGKVVKTFTPTCPKGWRKR
jgi:hypothetical protein